ncbi:L-rhamnose catabolism isomerase [Benzoatithermus flavus]|uniref:L-rhamnose catabolism isomerase n=1 Tax=Benzoatithermus flavus TaxID=3108223 RepID=A0ABU8XM98_9PROT
MTGYRIDDGLVAEHNAVLEAELAADYEHLGAKLARSGRDIEAITAEVQRFKVAVPTWGVGTGGTRFGRFPGPGEPRNVFEKLEDCATIQQLVRCAPTVSPHFPWDRVEDVTELKERAQALGLGFDAVNSNTFQDQRGQKLSYKFGSLTHTDPAVRAQAVQHNIECIEIGRKLGSKALTVWIADGANFPGQQHLTKAFERYLDSMRQIYAALPEDWSVFLEHKLYEPAFYTTVIADWGSSYLAATALGPKALCLVDLGHHAPNVNIEQIVARLIQFEKLAGFHFNDSKYGDDDLDSGSIDPFRLFLVFHELVNAVVEQRPGFAPAYMMDQSHNVTDPIESLMSSAIALQRAYAKALLVDRDALSAYQESNDAIMALETLKRAFETDVGPILATARMRAGGAIDPLAVYRTSGYRARKDAERPQTPNLGGGIV